MLASNQHIGETVSFKFVEKIEGAALQEIKEAWLEQANDDALGASVFRYEQDLAYFERVVSGAASQGTCYVSGVKDEASGAYRALITVSHNKPKSDSPYLKVLDLTLEPTLAAEDAQKSKITVGWVLATAMVGCLDLAGRNMPSREVKFFLNRTADKDLLLATSSALAGLREFSDVLDVDGHGSWVVWRLKD